MVKQVFWSYEATLQQSRIKIKIWIWDTNPREITRARWPTEGLPSLREIYRLHHDVSSASCNRQRLWPCLQRCGKTCLYFLCLKKLCIFFLHNTDTNNICPMAGHWTSRVTIKNVPSYLRNFKKGKRKLQLHWKQYILIKNKDHICV